MSHSMDQRYQTPALLAQDLRAFLDGRPISEPPRRAGWLSRLLSIA